MFSIEIPLIERDSKRFLVDKTVHLLSSRTEGTSKTADIDDYKEGYKYICSSIIVKKIFRTIGPNNVDIFDRSKIVSGCISRFVKCSRKQYNQLDDK